MFLVSIKIFFLDLGRENWCQYNVAYSFLNFINYVHKDFSEFDDIQGRLLDILQECANDYKFISTVPDFFPTLADMVVFRKIEFRSYLFDCILDNVVKYKLSFQDKMIILDAMYGMVSISKLIIFSFKIGAKALIVNFFLEIFPFGVDRKFSGIGNKRSFDT